MFVLAGSQNITDGFLIQQLNNVPHLAQYTGRKLAILSACRKSSVRIEYETASFYCMEMPYIIIVTDPSLENRLMLG